MWHRTGRWKATVLPLTRRTAGRPALRVLSTQKSRGEAAIAVQRAMIYGVVEMKIVDNPSPPWAGPQGPGTVGGAGDGWFVVVVVVVGEGVNDSKVQACNGDAVTGHDECGGPECASARRSPPPLSLHSHRLETSSAAPSPSPLSQPAARAPSHTHARLKAASREAVTGHCSTPRSMFASRTHATRQWPGMHLAEILGS